MPRTTSTSRSHARLPWVVAMLGAAVLAGPSVGTASAAKVEHAPCPTVGRTLAKDGAGPNLRVWRQGSTMKACSRWPGERRHVRTLGPWSSATKIAAGDGTVAWTTAAQPDGGVDADTVTTVDVERGDRWLRTAKAAVARDAATPASADRVLRLITNDVATAWVTSRGVVALAVDALDETATTDHPGGAPADLYRRGRQYFLGDAGPTAAAAVAQGLRFSIGGEHDECGGTDVHAVRIPAFGDRAAAAFTFAEMPVPAADGCAA